MTPPPNAFDQIGLDRSKEWFRRARPRLQIQFEGEQNFMASPHDDRVGFALNQMASFGTTSQAFAFDQINHIASVVKGQRSRATEQEMNAALAFVDGGEPQNEVEAALLVQMATTHSAALQCLLTAAGNLTLATDGGVGNLAVKLLRTYTAQVEALTKLRRGGEQVVRHIHVDNRGGQAVIAETVSTGGARNEKVDERSQATGAAASVCTSLLGENTTGHEVPISSGERPEAMSNARRDEFRTAQG